MSSQLRTENQQADKPGLHVIHGRDVGLFSLVQQVISHIPWAQQAGRVPVVFFERENVYYKPGGFRGKDTVWEYYFEPLDQDFPAAALDQVTRDLIVQSTTNSSHHQTGWFVRDDIYVSSNYGDSLRLKGKTLAIPWRTLDPSVRLRRRAHRIITGFIHPRDQIREQVRDFRENRMRESPVIGVHLRGTDAISSKERRYFRRNSLDIPAFLQHIEARIRNQPNVKILVATDEARILELFRDRFGDRVLAFDAIRHESGETAGTGPRGMLIPAFLASDPEVAALSGEQAIVECLLLAKCDHLFHNGSSLARTALLFNPELTHENLNPNARIGRLIIHLPQVFGEMIKRGLKKVRLSAFSFLRQSRAAVQQRRNKRQLGQIGKSHRSKADHSLVKQVKQEKKRIAGMGAYKDQPDLSLIVLSFNNAEIIPALADGLDRTSADELIICEDGSVDHSLETWVARLNRPNNFLIRSNDIHEIRAYDRAIHLARGQVVCILQDDDIPPPDGRWTEQAIRLFAAHPKLAVLGGFQGRIFGDKGQRFGVDYANQNAARPIPRLDPHSDIPFMFVHGVNIGPIFMRRRAYLGIGGFDYGFSAAGEPGIHSDYEICFRAWTHGYQVGLFEVAFERRAGVPGTLVYGSTQREKNARQNMQQVEEKYWGNLSELTLQVESLNAELPAREGLGE